MELEQMANLILNNGIAIAVVGYFMFRDYKFMGQLQTVLVTLVDTVGVLKDTVSELARKEDPNGD